MGAAAERLASTVSEGAPEPFQWAEAESGAPGVAGDDLQDEDEETGEEHAD